MPEEKVIPVRVALRIRPLIPRELSEGCRECLRYHPEESQVILGKDKAFTYDYVYSPKDSQASVYDLAVKPLVKSIFKGYNATVLAYGQTGSGKTHTMGGCYADSLSQDEAAMGVIPRVLRDLFGGIVEKEDSDFRVRVSYLEIYNEDIHDLLCPPSKREPLSVREDTGGEIMIHGLREIEVSSFEETMQCLERGSQGRTTGATAMNDTSSRSHAIFTIHVEQRQKNQDVDDFCKSKFHLVDLAGSERAKRTQAEGERMKEGININKGLLALGNVISALGEESQKRSHIPYRDTKLTRLLQDSLGGNSHTVMIACASPADCNMEETLNTFRYADRARKIKNKPVVNRDPQTAEILRLKQLVQQLQLQVLQNGGYAISASIDVTSTNASSSDDYKKLRERNLVLEDENSKLSRELQVSVDQSSRILEKNITLDMMCNDFRQRMEKLKQTGLDIELLSSSINVDTHPEAREQLDIIRKLTEDIKESKPENIPDVIFDVEDVLDPSDSEARTETPASKAFSTQYALRQAEMSRELQELNRLLSSKEELANQMTRNEDKLETVRVEYQNATKDMENEILVLQKERDTLFQALQDAKTNSAANKVSEHRRKRLQELEQQLGQLKKKLTGQSKMLKMKEQSDKHVTKLNTDIVSMKQQRVKLMKQIKEDADNFRKWRQKKDKEVMQLLQKDRKRQFEIQRMQKSHEKQSNVLRRKAEEAAASNKRLKDALAKQKVVVDERNKKQEGYDGTTIGNRVRSWLSQELELRVSIRDAKYHLQNLLADRKSVVEQLRSLKERLEDEQPPSKRVAWLETEEKKNSCDDEILHHQISTLEQDLELRNIQIADHQQKIVDADQDMKSKSTWEAIHTMTEAKCALKWLLEQAVASRSDICVAREQLKDSQLNHDDTSSAVQSLETELREMHKKQEGTIMRLQREHEDKVLFLLRQLKSAQSGEVNTTLDEETKERLKFQESEIERLGNISDHLQKKTDECEMLQKQLTMALYKGRKVSLMPCITSPGGSPYVTPIVNKTQQKRGKLNPEAKERMDYNDWILEELESSMEESFDRDDDSDSDWRATPMHKRTKKRRTSGSNTSGSSKLNNSSSNGCSCKTNCKTNKCKCCKNSNVCTEGCKCLDSKCQNRASDNKNDSVTENCTLNSTFIRDSSSSLLDFEDNKPVIKQPKKRLTLRSKNKENTAADDLFVKPTGVMKASKLVREDSGSMLDGGLKRKRKLLSPAGGYFSPLK